MSWIRKGSSALILLLSRQGRESECCLVVIMGHSWWAWLEALGLELAHHPPPFEGRDHPAGVGTRAKFSNFSQVATESTKVCWKPKGSSNCHIFPSRKQETLVTITCSRTGMHGFTKGLLVASWRAVDQLLQAQELRISVMALCTRPISSSGCHSQINTLFHMVALLPHVFVFVFIFIGV